MARAREDGPLGAESFLEHIAHRVERGAVCARDDELRERRLRKVVEREDGLCRRALDHQRPRALQELRRKLSGRSRGADESEEPPEELARIARSLAPVPVDPLDELVHARAAARDPECGRLDHRQRAHELGAS